MKISLDWLSDFVTFSETDPAVIAARLTEATGEVEEVEIQGAILRKCCVGKVLTINTHPNADKLLLVDVETDSGEKKVVCGGTNLRVGMKVAFAHTGATVRWHGTEMMTLEKVKIRGIESEGMICAGDELDIAGLFPATADQGERPIVELPDDAEVGVSLQKYLDLTDTVLHIDNHAITHRADLFSHMGFARECVALGLATWRGQKSEKRQKGQKGNFSAVPAFPKASLPFRFINEIPKLLPRYEACLLSIDSLGETPIWMKKRLEATGWRSVSLPIDITNYVMMELGMPLHSFDSADLKGDVVARVTKAGERITTLDGIDRPLPPGAIVLSDDIGIFDLLGIMGGKRSSTKDTTRSVYLHAAIVDPVTIRRTIIATGHRTDASTIYEKGVPRVAVHAGLTRALELFLDLVPGATIMSKLETQGDDGKAPTLTVSLDRVTRTLGIELSAKKVTSILENLEFTVKVKGKDALLVTPPLHRLGDIRGEHDVIEEIGRIYGYDAIPTLMPLASVHLPTRDPRMGRFRDALKEDQYLEILPLSLVGPALLTRAGFDPADAIQLASPLGEDSSLLHTSTLPSLLEHAARNLLLVDTELRTVHSAHVFRKKKPEHEEMTLLVTAKNERSLKDDPFLLVKSHLIHALASIGHTPEVTSVMQTPAQAHPGRFASLTVLGTVVGSLYEIHPEIRTRFGLPGRAAAATLDLTALLALPGSVHAATSQSLFPAVTYDETLTLAHSDTAGDLLRDMARASTLLESVRTVDLYSGKNLPTDAYNLTLRFVYRKPDGTLTEDEVQKEHVKVLAIAKNR